MDYFDDRGRLYEFTVLAESVGDDVSVECFDMTADGGGLIGVLRVAADGIGTLSLGASVSVTVLRRWLEVAEQQTALERPQ